jgi:DNA-binding MarR family transcriptional regulator
MDRLRNFGFLIKDVSRLSGLNFERHSVELNLSITQCKVLAHLQRNKGVTQVQLAELSEIDPMTLVRVIDRMEAEQWVSREPHPTDRRARCLVLKPAATPILQQMWRLADRARAEALAGFSADEKAQLMNLLERAHANLSALVAPAADVPQQEFTEPAKDQRKPAKEKVAKPQAKRAITASQKKLQHR